MSAVYDRKSCAFEITATVVDPDIYLLEDQTGNALVLPVFDFKGKAKVGDTCRVRGSVALSGENPFFTAYANSIDIIGHKDPTPPVEISGEDFISGRYDLRQVILHGKVDEIIPDEIDEVNQFVILQDGKVLIPMNISRQSLPPSKHRTILGHTVTVQGVGIPKPSTDRRLIGRTLSRVRITDISAGLTDPFLAPPLSRLRTKQPEILSRMGRHKVTGTVIATWGNGCALLRTDDGEIIRLEGENAKLIHANQRIVAVGFPETDLYTLILSRAIWRNESANAPPLAKQKPMHVTLADLLVDTKGHPRFNSRYHGLPIRFNGKILALPDNIGSMQRMIVEQGNFTIPVDISALATPHKKLTVGSEAVITAIAILETEKWRPNNIFPKINELVAVVRSDEDIVITKLPSWWTTGRMMAILAVLASVILSVLIWNVLLQRLAERRGQALAQSEITRAEADLKTSERTQLAIELHDALSQTLTAVSMEIETAQQFLDGSAPGLRIHLGIAEKALDSCRFDLRNCLWDLRNEALESTTMDEAVRTTLLPHVRDIALAIRFNVQRGLLSDSTAHSILCIIRELTVNAIRHGHASHIAIAGTLETDRLLFSVHDNGSGFDTDHAVGISQGHFGLQGIRERVRILGGSFELLSSIGHGTKATVSINLTNRPAHA